MAGSCVQKEQLEGHRNCNRVECIQCIFTDDNGKCPFWGNATFSKDEREECKREEHIKLYVLL